MLYQEHFKNECAYDLACMKICPMEIKITTAMKKLNNLSGNINKETKRKEEETA